MQIQNFFGAGYYEKRKEGIPHLNELGITDISLKNGVLAITLLRPGLLIGKKGSTIDQLQKYLSEDKALLKIKIIESKLWSRTAVFN